MNPAAHSYVPKTPLQKTEEALQRAEEALRIAVAERDKFAQTITECSQAIAYRDETIIKCGQTIALRDQTIVECSQIIAQREVTIAQFKKGNGLLNTQNRGLRDEITALRTQLAKSAATIDPRIAEFKASLEAASTRIAELEGQHSSANARIAELEGQHSSANARIAELQAQLEEAISENGNIRKQLASVAPDSETVISDLRRQLALVTTERNGAHDKLKIKDGHQARADQALCDLRKATSQFKATQAKLEMAENNLDLSNKACMAAENKLKAERRHFTGEIQALQAEVQAITERNKAIQADLQASAECNQALQADINSMRTDLRASTERIKILEVEVQSRTKCSFTFDASFVLSSHNTMLTMFMQDLHTELAQNSTSIQTEYSVALFGRIQNALRSIHSKLADFLISPQLYGVPVLTTTGKRFGSVIEADLATNPIGALTLPPTPPTSGGVTTALAAALAAAAKKKATTPPTPDTASNKM